MLSRIPYALPTCCDEQLLAQLAGDDPRSESAFRELYQRYEKTLLTRAVHVLGCEDTARDCLQDVFVSFWVKRGSLRIDNVQSYLHQAIRFRAFKFLKRNRLVAVPDVHPPRLADRFLPSDALEYKELSSLLYSSLQSLPVDQREIFLLHREHELTYAQIAERLRMSVKTVEKKMSLALRFLRRDVQKLLSEP